MSALSRGNRTHDNGRLGVPSANRIHNTASEVDFRASLPICPGQGVYVRLLIGRERRNPDRLKTEGQSRWSRVAAVQAAALFLLFGYAAFGLACFLYLVKSAAGIDILAGSSPLHPLYASIFS